MLPLDWLTRNAFPGFISLQILLEGYDFIPLDGVFLSVGRHVTAELVTSWSNVRNETRDAEKLYLTKTIRDAAVETRG